MKCQRTTTSYLLRLYSHDWPRMRLCHSLRYDPVSNESFCYDFLFQFNKIIEKKNDDFPKVYSNILKKMIGSKPSNGIWLNVLNRQLFQIILFSKLWPKNEYLRNIKWTWRMVVFIMFLPNQNLTVIHSYYVLLLLLDSISSIDILGYFFINSL